MAIRDKTKGVLIALASSIGERVIAHLIEKYLTRENVEQVLDGALDFLEVLSAKTETSVDDTAIAALRKALNVPDGND